MLDPVARLRRFNRAVALEIGALDQSYLGRGRPLGVARMLTGIGPEGAEVGQLLGALGIDKAQLSRGLQSLEAEGLIMLAADPGDGRRRIARLTEAGKAEVAEYERLSQDFAAEILSRHPRMSRLLDAMDLIASTLGQERIALAETDPTDPASVHCLGRYYAELAERFAQGFDVNLSRDPDAADMRAPRGGFLVAWSDGIPLGCVGLKGQGGAVAEVKRLWIAPAARGLGLSHRLMDRIEDMARGLEIATLRLDTNSALHEAVALYRGRGWAEIDRFNDDPYPDHFFEKHL
ncbi:bifunctional helix-turn-helix transcriptional regulator/GNAT family N-acetyltransferase [Mesobacterium pallidum]|uniref:bifunctional helix-turn-helix transcriptional regulator/GNAT family N-acetyltransferase n=1 Tax=Mesobacterium pallidum TaxID=2872037 RepID=UPI001EE33DC3|nr:helix-turn-helix domain-containing GNAT family N-acetyltransferase [Mesobacterium pallidum]